MKCIDEFNNSQVLRLTFWEHCALMWQLISYVTHHLMRQASNAVRHSHLFLFWFFTQACVHLFIRLWLKTIQAVKKESKTTSLIEPRRQQKKMDSKKRHCPFDSTDVAFCCLHGWSFSLCVLLSPPRSSCLSPPSLPAVFNGWVQAGKKERERVSETDGEEKRDEEDEDGGEGRRGGGGLPSPGKALMKSLWSCCDWAAPVSSSRRDQHLSEDTSPLPLPSSFPSLPLDSLAFCLCQFHVRSSPPLSHLLELASFATSPFTSPLHLSSVSVIRTWIMSPLN